MQVNSPDTAPDYTAGNLREGTLDAKVLLKGQEGSLNNYRFSWEVARDQWSTPRHRHNFDQIRYPVAGEVEYGGNLGVLPIGVVAYFPESMYYGPQIRHDNSVTVTIQFGGASLNGFLSPEERRRGFDGLLQKGKFEKGVFTWYDETGKKHNKDSYEAVWEHIRGRKLKYPPPRYRDHIIMNPQNCAWMAVEQQPGVQRKWLGSYTERQIHCLMWKIAPGARLSLPGYPAPQILFVTAGSVSVNGKQYGIHTAFGLDPGEALPEMTGVTENEILMYQLPLFTAQAQDEYRRSMQNAGGSKSKLAA